MGRAWFISQPYDVPIKICLEVDLRRENEQNYVLAIVIIYRLAYSVIRLSHYTTVNADLKIALI